MPVFFLMNFIQYVLSFTIHHNVDTCRPSKDTNPWNNWKLNVLADNYLPKSAKLQQYEREPIFPLVGAVAAWASGKDLRLHSPPPGPQYRPGVPELAERPPPARSQAPHPPQQESTRLQRAAEEKALEPGCCQAVCGIWIRSYSELFAGSGSAIIISYLQKGPRKQILLKIWFFFT